MPVPSRSVSELDTVPDLELRLVRYFVVLAAHLNFARAAAELHVAQPSLSRQIQRLEDQLGGVRLLDRTTRGSRLSDAGAAFLPRARDLLRAADRATRTARAAATPSTITIGYADDLVITSVVRALRHDHPGARIRSRHLAWGDGGAVSDRRLDVLVTRLPLARAGEDLAVTVLYEEPRVLVVPVAHRLAGKESVTADDLARERFAACSGATTSWQEFWRLEPRGDGSRAPVDEETAESFEDKLETVASGRAVALLPSGDRRTRLREDLTTVPVTGIEPSQVAVVTRLGEHHPLVGGFCDIARSTLAPAA